MANFFDPAAAENPEQFFAPFGPGIGYKKLSDTFVNYMNTSIETKGADMVDYSASLVGKVRQELHFTAEMKAAFSQETTPFVGRYAAWSEVRNSFGSKKLDSVKNRYGVEFKSGWVVRQHEHDYNPIHIHTGCRLSCVGYLKLPDNIEKEFAEDYQDHHPSHGHIQFVHGTPSHWSMTNFMVRPRVGDFYLFPSDLFHCTYPFSTEGERRSFSCNLNFVMMPHEAKDDKLAA